MATDELKKYIKEALQAGKDFNDIQQTLLKAGWSEVYIQQAFKELEITEQSFLLESENKFKTKIPRDESRGFTRARWLVGIKTLIVYSILLFIIVILGGIILYLWQDRLDLKNTNIQKVREFYTRLSQSQISFTDTSDMVFPDEKKFITQKNQYIQDKTSFIEANLRTMEISIYENGVVDKTMKILSKGKEQSWWETPTGNYKVLGKSINGYSSIGDVWMPYSVQFYGNYLIHGWPHYNNGTPVPQGYSGGCIRLSNEDAKEIFNFTKIGMPVLVLEDYPEYSFGLLLAKEGASASLPSVSAKAFLISDLSSGEIILTKNSEEKLPIASLTKLTTGVVAHEVIYLGRSIKVTPQMLANVAGVFSPMIGESYIGMDLMYPLLMQSSNNSAKVLSSFIGENNFVDNMNAKADSLQMTDTKFADPSGLSSENISTARDISKLLQYIYYKRPFIFDIGKGVIFENVGLLKIGDTIKVGDLKNFNEFIDEVDLIGVKNGETSVARQTIATVWNIHTPQGNVPVAIVVLGSENRKMDTDILLRWFKENFMVL